MNTYSFIGIDISKQSFEAAVPKIKGSGFKSKTFNNNQKGFDALLKWAQKHCSLDKIWVCMEATGRYSTPLADFLSEKKVNVTIVNPLSIKYHAKAALARNKNDRIDAMIISEYAAVFASKLRLYKPKSVMAKRIKELLNLHDAYKKHLTQLKNLLEANADKEVKKYLQKQIKTQTKLINELEVDIKVNADKDSEFNHQVQLLITIKGIGCMSAIRIVALTPDINNFKEAKKLVAFIGSSPQQNESGQFQGMTKISKYGHSALRKALYMPAMTAKNTNEHLKPFVTRLQNKGMAPKAIICAVMRKLIHIIFGILKSNKPFNSALV